MKITNTYFRWQKRDGEHVILWGVVWGKVSYMPTAKYLYSFRMFVWPFRFEVCCTTQEQ